MAGSRTASQRGRVHCPPTGSTAGSHTTCQHSRVRLSSPKTSDVRFHCAVLTRPACSIPLSCFWGCCGGGLGPGSLICVQPGSENGHAGTNERLLSHCLVEEDNRRKDDGNALHNIAHAMGNRAHALQRVERKLVVQVIQETHCGQVHVEALSAHLKDGCVHACRQQAALHQQCQRHADEHTDECGPCVHCCAVKRLGHG
mmetsp:Transcript_17319/g.29595  ORF Transcript_17319/g.29595 Transcript_17319/m.29595 type:complete len:200 (+) Transcript_17319:535-1134(+)